MMKVWLDRVKMQIKRGKVGTLQNPNLGYRPWRKEVLMIMQTKAMYLGDSCVAIVSTFLFCNLTKLHFF